MKIAILVISWLLSATISHALSVTRAIPQGYQPMANVKSSTYGAQGDGVASDRAAVAAAISACGTAGGVVYIPPGTYSITSSITMSGVGNCVIQGASPELTILDCSSLNGDCLTSSTTLNSYTIKNLTIKGSSTGGATTNALKLRKTEKDINVENVNFNLTTGQGIYCNGCTNLSVRGGTFYSDGDFLSSTERPRAIYIDQGADTVRITGSTFEYMYDSVYVVGSSSSPIRNLSISGNSFEGGGWTSKTRYTNSGGTVTYSSTGLTDSSAPFSANGIASTTVIRVLTTAQAGSITSTSGGQITDTNASFPSTTIRGDIIRTSTAFAVVEQRISATALSLGEWRDLTTYRPVAMPAVGASYTLYDVVLGEASNSTNTTTAVTVYKWYDPAGVSSTPSSGSLYEVLWYRGGYGVKTTANVNNVMITNNIFKRMPSAGVELSGSGSIFSMNLCKDGMDGCIGIQGGGRSSIIGNISDHTMFFVALYQGSTGDGGSNVVTGNVIKDTHWANHGSPPTYTGYPVVIRSSDNNIISDNVIEKGSIVTGTAEYGIFIDDDPVASSGNDATGNFISGNMISGFDTASIRLEDADAASTILSNLLGATISNNGSVSTLIDGLSATDSPGTCNSSATGMAYFDLSLAERCTCNGTGWVQNDGGGAC